MSKRGTMDLEHARTKASRTDDDTPLDTMYARELKAWEAVQTRCATAMDAPFEGMIAEVDAEASYRAHRARLEREGYRFGTYSTHRSLFEKLDDLVFRLTPVSHMARTVFDEVKSLLEQINKGSTPKRGSFSLLVMMNPQYVPPLSDLVHLLTHPKATAEDLDLFWELTDRVWCFAHPIYRYHSGHLDETCDAITKRLAEVTAA